MKSKIDINTVKSLSTFSTSIAAGILIGFGVIINLTVEISANRTTELQASCWNNPSSKCIEGKMKNY